MVVLVPEAIWNVLDSMNVSLGTGGDAAVRPSATV